MVGLQTSAPERREHNVYARGFLESEKKASASPCIVRRGVTKRRGRPSISPGGCCYIARRSSRSWRAHSCPIAVTILRPVGGVPAGEGGVSDHNCPAHVLMWIPLGHLPVRPLMLSRLRWCPFHQHYGADRRGTVHTWVPWLPKWARGHAMNGG